MNLFADESVDRQIVDRLRQDGHVVWYVAEMEPGISDDRVLDLANYEADVLLTADKDFGELVFRHGRLTSGICSSGWQVYRRCGRQISLLLPSVNMAQSFQALSPCLHQGLFGFAG